MIGLLQLCRAADGQSVARRAVIEQRAAAGKLSLVVRARPRELVLICLRPGQIDRVQRGRLAARQLLAQCAGTGKAGRQLLPRAVFEEDDVRAGDALRAADIHEQAVRLQALDEGIDFLEYYARLLRADGTIHLKTDSKHLYAYTNEVIRRFGLPCAVSNPDIYGSGYADEVLSVKTAYEQLFLGMGLPITYTRFSLGGRREFPWFDWEEDEKPEKDNEAERGNR